MHILEYCPIKDYERYKKGEEAAKFFQFFRGRFKAKQSMHSKSYAHEGLGFTAAFTDNPAVDVWRPV